MAVVLFRLKVIFVPTSTLAVVLLEAVPLTLTNALLALILKVHGHDALVVFMVTVMLLLTKPAEILALLELIVTLIPFAVPGAGALTAAFATRVAARITIKSTDNIIFLCLSLNVMHASPVNK